MTPDLLLKGPHIHISSVFLLLFLFHKHDAHERIYISLFLSILLNHVHFY